MRLIRIIALILFATLSASKVCAQQLTIDDQNTIQATIEFTKDLSADPQQKIAKLLEARDICLRYKDIQNAMMYQVLMAWYCMQTHQYETAEIMLNECKGVCESNLNVYQSSEPYRLTLNFLSELMIVLNNYDKANELLLAAKYLYEQRNEVNSVYYGNVLLNLAHCYSGQKYYYMAKTHADVGWSIIEKVAEDAVKIGAANIMFVVYNNFKGVERQMQYYGEYVVNLTKKIYGNKGDYYALALNNFAAQYIKQGNYAIALRYYEEVLDCMHQNHSLRYLAASNLFICYYFLNDPKIIEFTAKEIAHEKRYVQSIFDFMSEEQRSVFWSERLKCFVMFDLITHKFQTAQTAGLSYDNALFSKGLLLRTTNLFRDAINKSADPVLIAQWDELLTLKRTVLTSSDSLRQKIEDKINKVNKDLAQKVTAYKEYKEERIAVWSDVHKMVGTGDAAIEFVKIAAGITGIRGIQDIDSIMYAALIVRSDCDSPIYVPLCNAEDVDSLLGSSAAVPRRHIESLYSWGDPKFFHGEQLYRAIWQPIEKHLKGIKNIYYSPIASLHGLSFQAIGLNDSTTLADRYSMHLTSSTAQIASIKSSVQIKPHSAVLYGGIKYDLEEQTMISQSRNYSNDSRGETVHWQVDSTVTDRAGWRYLPGTKVEVDKITTILNNNTIKYKSHTDSTANEESFKALALNNPSILHIATHGFFLSSQEDARGALFVRNLDDVGGKKISWVDPLLCSGLLMAGANRAWMGESTAENIDDGILTALEVASLNLSKIQIAVLSACETARGQTSLDGVFGLQRAFKLAGVQTVIMSLWKVPDSATSELMISFYGALMQTGDRQIAFAKSIEQIKAKHPSPYYWAGFVMLD